MISIWTRLNFVDDLGQPLIHGACLHNVECNHPSICFMPQKCINNH